MIAHVYQIKRENSEKEIITQRREFVLFNTLMHTTCTCTIMATALKKSMCISNMALPQHIQAGQYGMLKFKTRNIQLNMCTKYKTPQDSNI